MKLSSTLVALALFQVLAIAQPITTFPYSENFDGFATCGTSSGTVCPLSAGWTNLGGDNGDWLPDCCGTGSTGTGPTGDAPAHGGGQYLYMETSATFAGWEDRLRSPDFNISMSPGVGFQFWYHMYGADIGELRVETWDPVAMMYNTVFSLMGQQQTSNGDAWLQTPVLALPATGDTHVRIVGVNAGGGFTSDIAVDLFEAADFSAPSMSVDSVDGPVAVGCTIGGAAEVISISWSNLSTTPAMSVPIQYTITGPIPAGPVIEMIPTAAAGSSGTFDFAATADFSAPGTYSIDVTVMLPGDTNPMDDTASRQFLSNPGTPLPICEDWEAGPNGWSVQGISSFALGMPAGGVIMGAPPSGGVNSWMTNLTGLYSGNEDGWVESGDILCNLISPEVVLDIWWESEFSWDGAVLQSSIDAGATWQNVGAFGDPNNWYTDNTINGMPGGQSEGWTGRNGTGSPGWVVASHDLPGIAGQVARLRIAFGSDGSVNDEGFAFDNLMVREIGLNTDFDIGASTPAQPVQSTPSATDVVAVQFLLRANGGADLLRGIDLVASGSGDDSLDVLNVSIWHEDPMTTNGVVDPGTDVEVFSGLFPADDGTISATFPSVTMLAGVDQNFLVAYDFSATASGLTPPALFTVTVNNALVCGALNLPMIDPTGTIEVNPCFTTLCGDCNLDGATNILDSLTAAQHSAGLVIIAPMTAQFSNCNVQGAVEPDPMASIDILDALNIAQFAAGLPTPLTCC